MVWVKKSVAMLLFLGIFLTPQMVYAAEDYMDEMMQELKLDEVDEAVEENVTQLPDKYTFSDMVQSFVAEGTDGISRDHICDYVFDLFFYEIAAVKPLFIQIISMSILFAFFGKLLVTKSQYVSEMSFFVVYTGIMLLLLQSFQLISEVVESGIGKTTSFMTAFIPTYATTLLLSGNTASAGSFYGLAFGIVYVLELAMKFLFIPGVHIYVLLVLLDHLFEESKLSKFAELFESGIYLSLKVGLAVVMGMGVVQSLIAPAKDRLSVSSLYQGLKAVPGVGNSFGAAGELLVGCTIMIKNSMGAAALLVLVILSLEPVLKVLCFHVMYRLASAVLQPFCDKRLAESIAGVGKGCGIYLKIMWNALLLFFLTISMIAASTGFIN